MTEVEKEQDETELTCSFCGKPESQVHTLVKGVCSFICDRCIITCADILATRFTALRDRLKQTTVVMDALEKLRPTA